MILVGQVADPVERVRVVWVATVDVESGRERLWSLDELMAAHPYLFG